jgi:hypothetical protein
MKKGILNALTYYIVGLVVTILAYFTFDNSYPHAPSVYHLVAFFTLLGGVLWTVVVIVQFFFVERTRKRKGVIVANVIVLMGFFMIVYFAAIRPYQ